MLVGDVVNTKIQLDDVHELADKIPMYVQWITWLADALNRTAHEVSHSNDSTFRFLFSTLSFSIDITKHTLYAVVEYTSWRPLLTTPQAHTIQRRGLCNIGGKVLGNILV